MLNVCTITPIKEIRVDWGRLMRARRPTFHEGSQRTSDARLCELMLHVARKSSEDKNFGATKLHKLLWWSDTESFARLGKSITGTRYQKLPHGPGATRLKPVQDQLVLDGDAEVDVVDFPNGFRQHRLVALRDPDLSAFTEDQLAIIDDVIEQYWEKTGAEVSELSHGPAWQVAKLRGRLPYDAVFLTSDPPTDADRNWAIDAVSN